MKIKLSEVRPGDIFRTTKGEIYGVINQTPFNESKNLIYLTGKQAGFPFYLDLNDNTRKNRIVEVLRFDEKK